MEKKHLITSILGRANSTLYFLEHLLVFQNVRGDDPAWQRSILMMLSYAFELVLKAELVRTENETNIQEIEMDLRRYLHNVHKVLSELDRREALRGLGIVNYVEDSSRGFKCYIVKFNDSAEVLVEDFVDIRYDFTKTVLRSVTDHDRIVSYVQKTIELGKQVNNSL